MNKKFVLLLTVIIILLSGCSGKLNNKAQDKDILSLRNSYKMNIYDIRFKQYELNEDGNLSLYEKAPFFNVIDKMCIENEYNMYDNKRLKEIIKKYNDTFRIASDNKDYIISDYKSGVCINKYVGKDRNVIIPETLDGKKVIKLGAYIDCYFGGDEFSNEYSSPFAASPVARKIESVTLPKTVKFISLNALHGISSVGWYDTYKSSDHSLESIYVDEDNPYYSSVDGILYTKDKGCLLQIPMNYKNTTINIPNGTKAVYSLSSQNAKAVNIPSTVVSFGEHFNKKGESKFCFDEYPRILYDFPLRSNPIVNEIKNICSFNVDKSNEYYSSQDGVLFNKEKTILIAYPVSSDRKNYVVPDSVKVLGSFDLSTSEKRYCNLKEIIIGKNVDKIYADCQYRSSPLIIKGYKGTAAEDFVNELHNVFGVDKDEVKFVSFID